MVALLRHSTQACGPRAAECDRSAVRLRRLVEMHTAVDRTCIRNPCIALQDMASGRPFWDPLITHDWVQDHAKWGVTAAAPPDCCELPGRGSPLGAAVCFADLNRCSLASGLGFRHAKCCPHVVSHSVQRSLNEGVLAHCSSTR